MLAMRAAAVDEGCCRSCMLPSDIGELVDLPDGADARGKAAGSAGHAHLLHLYFFIVLYSHSCAVISFSQS